MGQGKQITVRVKNIYAIEVEYACKSLRSKAYNRDVMVERKHVRPLNMQPQNKPQEVVEQP